MLSKSPFILLVNPSLGANSMADLLALARSKPGKLNYGTTGIGGGPHLAAQMMVAAAKIDAQHVPFNGSAPLLTALPRTSLISVLHPAALPSIRAGSLKALGVTSLERSPILPDVPTFDETIKKGFDMANWSSILAPDNTPPEIVKFINELISRALKSPDLSRVLKPRALSRCRAVRRSCATLWSRKIKEISRRVGSSGGQATRAKMEGCQRTCNGFTARQTQFRPELRRLQQERNNLPKFLNPQVCCPNVRQRGANFGAALFAGGAVDHLIGSRVCGIARFSSSILARSPIDSNRRSPVSCFSSSDRASVPDRRSFETRLSSPDRFSSLPIVVSVGLPRIMLDRVILPHESRPGRLGYAEEF